MHAVWIDAGNDPDAAKLKRYGIEVVYFAANEDRLSASYLANVAAEGFKVGIYAAWNWQDWTPGAFATWVHQRLLQIGSPLNPWVCLDIETHDVSWIIGALTAWRQLRPKRMTDWALEPMQGGLFSPDDVRAIQRCQVGVVPANYGGSMQAFAADRVVIDLIARGFNPLLLQGFYDAAALPIGWEGYAFTQGRLP